MKYDIYYLNSAGIKLDLCKIPYLLETGDFLDWEWDYTISSNVNSHGGKIGSFRKPVQSRTVELSVFAMSEDEYKAALDDLVDVTEYDIINETPGKLYVNGNYLQCYITAGEVSDWESTSNIMSLSLTITTEYAMWIIRREWNFAPTGNLAKGYKKYPGRYPYRYANGSTSGSIMQGSNSPAHFQIVLHGPVSDPQITIDGKIYGVVNVDLEKGEYVTIDSFAGTVMKYCNDGTSISVFNSRTRAKNSVFERLKSGTLKVTWTGEYLISIVVFEERGLPRWNLLPSTRRV